VLVAAGGCGSAAEFFTAHAPDAAEAGGARLRAGRLGQLLANMGRQIPVDREGATFLADTWLNYCLFVQAVTSPPGLTDSATAAEVLWPQMLRLRLEHWRDSLAQRRAPPAATVVDSAFAAGNERLFQLLVIKVPANATPAERATARRRTEQLRARLDAGADFGTLAAQISDDPATRGEHGYFRPTRRGEMVTALDSAGWALSPGAYVGPIDTRAGYYLIRRPPLPEVRERWAAWMVAQDRPRLDAEWAAQLAERNQLTLAPGVPKIVRAALGAQDDALHSTRTLATYAGGSLTEGELMRWMVGIGPHVVFQVRRMRDPDLTKFVRSVAQTKLALRVADSAGVRVTPTEWDTLRQGYQTDLDSLRSVLRLDATAADSARYPEWIERTVNRFFDRYSTGEIHIRPPASALAILLRDRLPHRLIPAGIGQAVTLAAIEIKRKDSTAVKKHPPSGLRRAPGPPPLPQAPGESGAAARKVS
jgi:hypothetical protein